MTFINRSFGTGLFPGAVNVLLWLSYIVMLALYAQAFGSYAASFLPRSSRSVWKHVFLTAAVALIALLNVAGASTVARAERYVVAIKIAILLLFVVVGFAGVSATRLAPAQWASQPAEAIDPVCGMTVQRASAVKAVVDGQELFFCSTGCREHYLAEHPQNDRSLQP